MTVNTWVVKIVNITSNLADTYAFDDFELLTLGVEYMEELYKIIDEAPFYVKSINYFQLFRNDELFWSEIADDDPRRNFKITY